MGMPSGGVAMRAARKASAAGPSLVATEIFLWLTRIPTFASSALSTLRTVCFGDTSVVVNTCTSLTSPVGPGTMRTFNTPGSVTNSSSARSIGSTAPAMIGDTSAGVRDDRVGGTFSGFADTVNLAGDALCGAPTWGRRGARGWRGSGPTSAPLAVGGCEYFTYPTVRQGLLHRSLTFGRLLQGILELRKAVLLD